MAVGVLGTSVGQIWFAFTEGIEVEFSADAVPHIPHHCLLLLHDHSRVEETSANGG